MSLRSRLALYACVPAVVALAFAGQSYSSRVIEGQTPVFWSILRLQLAQWYAWAPVIAATLFAADRWPLTAASLTRRVPLWLAFAIAAALVQSAIFMTIGHYLRWLQPPAPPEVPRLGFGILVRFQGTVATNLLYFATVGLAIHLAAYRRESQARALREVQLAARLAGAELQSLKAQIHPHFLFNTLNTVSSLMESDADRARSVLASLGDLLRMSLDDLPRQEVPLRRELDFLDRYLDIQRARFRDRLRLAMRVDASLDDALVPNLLLQPLVENALRHGIEPRRVPGTVEIDISRAAGPTGATVVVSISNDNDRPPSTVARSAGGMGLRNVAGRLEQLYGANHRFSAGQAGDRFSARIEIPLRFATLQAQ